MNKNFLFILQFLFSTLIVAQKPVLRIYTDKKEINKPNALVLAWVKVGSKLHPILNADGKTIELPREISYQQIDALKFVVESDTILFPVTKLIEQSSDQTSSKTKEEELKKIFQEVSKWDLHVDHFKYFSEKELLEDANEGQKRNTVYSHYKIYALRTTSFKYYVVKG